MNTVKETLKQSLLILVAVSITALPVHAISSGKKVLMIVILIPSQLIIPPALKDLRMDLKLWELQKEEMPFTSGLITLCI